MKTMRQKQVYSTIRNIVALTFIISGCSGLIQAYFNCSNYTFHENSTEGRSWETSRLLCQNSSEGDLVSIEEEEERNFVINIIKNLTAIKYFIGLKKDNGKWKWLSNQTTVNSSQGKSPWAPGEPAGTPDRKDNCATIYGIYLSDLGLFDDMSCTGSAKDAGHICERAVSCTKHERDSQATKERQKVTSVHSLTRTQRKTQPFPPTAEIDSIAPAMTHLEKADGSSYLIAIIVSVLASFVILGTCVTLLLFSVYRSRKKDHVMQDLGEEPSQVMVDEENCKPSAAISSAGLEKELTRDEDAIVKQNASAQNQCIDCVYAVVDKTKKKLPPAKPAPYQELVYADLSHSPKKSKNGRFQQESTAGIYADIDHVESSAMSDSSSLEENEVEPTE